MYTKVLLAYDGSIEGRRALREGAKLAQLCRAEVFLLAVVELPSIVTGDAGLVISKRQITNPSLRRVWSGSRRWVFHLPQDWKREIPGKKLRKWPRKSERSSSLLVIARKGR